jgi:hypothetical protein
MMRPYLSQYVCGLEGCGRCFVSLVPRAATGPVYCLLYGIDCQQAEADRKRMVHRYVAKAASRLTRHVVEMGRLAPDHGAERH